MLRVVDMACRGLVGRRSSRILIAMLKRWAADFLRCVFSQAVAVGILLTSSASIVARAEEGIGGERVCTLEIPIDGAISAATYDFLERGFALAEREGCRSILLTLNTPGGSLQTTRMIVERIMASRIPVLCVVAPEGGHAGSAGALILLACHVSGVLPATNIGAATPIGVGGNSLTDDLRAKVIEDTKSWAVSLAKKRGRSAEFAEKIIAEAKAYDADSALKLGAIDLKAKTIDEFVQASTGREVDLDSGTKVRVETGARRLMQPDLREHVLSFLADPEFSYLLFMAALVLLYFEITHPGAIAPGVVGGLLLVTSLIAFQKLDVVWGGVGLMLLGISFLVAEAFVPSFGALGVGGIVALGAGSILLYDPANGGLSLSPWLAVGVPLTVGAALLAVAILVVKGGRRRGESLAEAGLVGAEVEIDRVDGSTAFVTVRGEIWRVAPNGATASTPAVFAVGDIVRIEGISGLSVIVKPVKKGSS